jgi:hypothetical protein
MRRPEVVRLRCREFGAPRGGSTCLGPAGAGTRVVVVPRRYCRSDACSAGARAPPHLGLSCGVARYPGHLTRGDCGRGRAGGACSGRGLARHPSGSGPASTHREPAVLSRGVEVTAGPTGRSSGQRHDQRRHAALQSVSLAEPHTPLLLKTVSIISYHFQPGGGRDGVTVSAPTRLPLRSDRSSSPCPRCRPVGRRRANHHLGQAREAILSAERASGRRAKGIYSESRTESGEMRTVLSSGLAYVRAPSV